jgi:hypothetical protein
MLQTLYEYSLILAAIMLLIFAFAVATAKLKYIDDLRKNSQR